MNRYAFIVYYDKRVRYGLNSIIASLDKLPNIDIYLVEDRNIFLETILFLEEKYRSRCVVGLSLLTTMLAEEDFLAFIYKLKNIGTTCIKIVGGPHASGDPIGSILSLGFDYVFVGEAEESIYDFFEKLLNKEDLFKVKGIFLRGNNSLIYTGKREPVDLDKYPPFPYWRYLFNPIEITRGCPYGCKYCQVTFMHGGNMRHRSIDNILLYIGHMVRNGIRDIRFISPNSLAYGARSPREIRYDLLEELLSSIYQKYTKRHGARIFFGTFPSEVRPEYIDRDTARILRKYVANKEIIIGAQSGSNRLLKLMNRGHSIEDVYNAVDILNEHGFRVSIDYILGLPMETEEDLLLTLDSIKKLVKKNVRIHLHTFIPLPGTPYSYTSPKPIPNWFRREISKIIGMGKAYGEWIYQEKIAYKLVELREKGIIMPRKNYGFR